MLARTPSFGFFFRALSYTCRANSGLKESGGGRGGEGREGRGGGRGGEGRGGEGRGGGSEFSKSWQCGARIKIIKSTFQTAHVSPMSTHNTCYGS